MLKEIFEQPDALANTIRGRLDPGGGTAILSGLNLSPRELAAVRRLVIVGCGTSLHAGMVGKCLFESLADIPASPEQAAEFRYSNPIVGPDDWVIALSQSGETADTLAAVRESIRKGALVSALCNVVGSTIAREAGRGVYLHAGPEISVASTKAFTAQVTALLMTALKLGRTRRLSREAGDRLVREITSLPDLVRKVLAQSGTIAQIAEKYASANDMS
jgi:glucosamine--fructose-6-phosphate aminotransferase (isomerizing)